MPVLVGFLVLPFAPDLIIRDMNVGVLLIFAFSTFTVLAILAGGGLPTTSTPSSGHSFRGAKCRL